jgi:hypothetical protein
MTETIEIEKDKILNEDLPALHSTTTALVVKDKGSREFAVTHIKALKEVKEKIETVFHPTQNKVAAHKVYEMALDTERKFYAVLDEDIKRANVTVKSFDTQEAIKVQREAEARRQEEDRKERERQAEIQRKIDAENEKIRAAKAEEARISFEKQEAISRANKADRERLQKIENERREKEDAELAELQRKATLKTEKLVEKMEAAPVPVFTPPAEPTKKLTTKASVISIFKVCKLIAVGVIPFNVLEASQVNLNNWAKTQDVKTKYDGIELFATTTRI